MTSSAFIRRIPLEIVAPFALVTVIWGSTWLVIRDQLSLVPPNWSIAYRFAVAAAVMFALAVHRKVPINLGTRGFCFAFLIGLTQFMLNFSFVYRAEHYITSGIVALVYALLLIPNTALSSVFFGQKVSGRFIVGSAIAIIGIVMLFLHEYRYSTTDPTNVVLGIGFSIAGVMSASIANVLQITQVARQLPILSVMAWAMLLGAAMDAVIALALNGPPVFDSRPAYLAGVLYLGIIGSAVTFPLYFQLIRRIGASRAAYTSVLTPVFAMLLSTMFEGYRWSLLTISGALLALFGMVVALRARQKYAS